MAMNFHRALAKVRTEPPVTKRGVPVTIRKTEKPANLEAAFAKLVEDVEGACSGVTDPQRTAIAITERFGGFLDDHVDLLKAHLGIEPAEPEVSKGEITMDAVVAVAKIAAGGGPNPYTQDIWFQEISDRAAQIRKAGEREDQAFSRFVTETEEGRLMFQAQKSARRAEPRPVIKEQSAEEKLPSYQKLREKAEDLRKEQPRLSQEVAFAKVYQDPRNRDLVALHKRATTALRG